MPENPDSVSPVSRISRPMTFGRGKPSDSRTRTVVGKRQARSYDFAGNLRSEAHYLALVAWSKKTNAITITDHVGQVFRVLISEFDPTDRPSARNKWRTRYTMKSTLLGGPS